MGRITRHGCGSQTVRISAVSAVVQNCHPVAASPCPRLDHSARLASTDSVHTEQGSAAVRQLPPAPLPDCIANRNTRKGPSVAGA